MTKIALIETAGDDGVLRLQVPVEDAGKRYRVLLQFELESTEIDSRKTQGEHGGAAAAELAAWERLSDELSADIGWE